MTATKLCLLSLCAALVSADPIVPAVAAAQTCDGDCNGDGSVAIDEIILGLRIAFVDAPIRNCRAMDADGNGAVTINELVAAVTRALQGCRGPVPQTSTPAPTNTPVPTTVNKAGLEASTRVTTEPIVRLFDLQAGFDAIASIAGASPAGMSGTAGVTVCQTFDCVALGRLAGTREACCSDGQFSQFFSNCTFDDDLGRIVILNGLFVLLSDTADVCSGAMPVGVSFAASLSNFTRDILFPDGSFSRTFHELSETFDAAPDGCAESQPAQSGFGVRGDGRRLIDGAAQQFQTDGLGNVLVNTETDADGLVLTVGSRQDADGCTVAAALNGSLTSADFRVGQFANTDFTDFGVVQHSQAGALLLGLNGRVRTDCIGDVTLTTAEPLRVAPGDPCFTAGRLEVELGGETAAATYTGNGGLDLDFGADGGVDRQFAKCTDARTDQCSTGLVGLCGACTVPKECQTGLSCFPCSRNCSGSASRCALSDTFVTCEDGVF